MGFLFERLLKVGVMPLATGFLLAEQANATVIVKDGELLGQIIVDSVERFHTPLALPPMDLNLEKFALCRQLGLEEKKWERFQFITKPDVDALVDQFEPLSDPYLSANLQAISMIAKEEGLIPAGMAIGPFSLAIKFMQDPITPIYLAGMGAEDESVELFESILALSMGVVQKYVLAQLHCGAKIIVLAEPGANTTYFSPIQIKGGATCFQRYAMDNLHRLNATIKKTGAELFFHCCGELCPEILHAFSQMEPLVLSLGSSRNLWQDAEQISPNTIIYGNLPSKKFFNDKELTVEEVYKQSLELIEKMISIAHPFILGTECDVLSVPGYHQTISRKIDAMYEAYKAKDMKRGAYGRC